MKANSKPFAPAGQVLLYQEGGVCHYCFDSPQISQTGTHKCTPVVFLNQGSHSSQRGFSNHPAQQEFRSLCIKNQDFST